MTDCDPLYVYISGTISSDGSFYLREDNIGLNY
jgi:hypothetical protein